MNNFKREIHERALVAAREFKRAEAQMIRILQEVEESKLFLDLGLTSLFQYAVGALGLSEDVASNFILAARKSKQIPILKEAIENGSVSVSKIRKAASVLTLENKEEWPQWIDKMKTFSSRELEREVAKENPKEAVPERTKYVSENRLELKMGISQEMLDQFKKIQDLESKRTGKAVSLEETLEAVFHVYLDVKDPVKRADRILFKKLHAPGRTNRVIHSGKKAIPAREKHRATLRDQGQCTHEDNGTRCENKRWTEIHHIVPRSVGGDHSIENLTTLCSTHHKMVHRE
jgi:5-methylcytosine-specific restriction endonuclease McrA